MIKYFCDKCGKEIGDYNMSELFKVTVEPPEVRSWMDEAEAGTYILCYDCIKELNKCIDSWRQR